MANKSAISNYIFNKLSESIETIMEKAINDSLTEESNKEEINEKIMGAINNLNSQDTDKLLQSAKIPITYSFWTNELSEKNFDTYKEFEDAVKDYQKNTKGGKRKSHKKRKYVKTRKTNKQKGGHEESIEETEDDKLENLKIEALRKLKNEALQNIKAGDKTRVDEFVSNKLSVDNNKTINEGNVTEEILQACIYIYNVLPETYEYSDINMLLKTVFESWKRKFYKRFTNNKNQDVKISHINKYGKLNDRTVVNNMYYEKNKFEYTTPRDYYTKMTNLHNHFDIINTFKKTEYEVTNSVHELHGIPISPNSTVYTYKINGKKVEGDSQIYEIVTKPPKKNNIVLTYKNPLTQLKKFYDDNKSSIEHVVLGKDDEYNKRIHAEITRLQKKYEEEAKKAEDAKNAEDAKKAEEANEEERQSKISNQLNERKKQIEEFEEKYSSTASNPESNKVAPQNRNTFAKVNNLFNPSNLSIANNIVKSIEDSITASVMNKTNLIVDNINNAFNGGKFKKTLKTSIEAYIQEKVFENFNRNNQVGEIMRTELTNLGDFIKTQNLLLLVEGENKKRIKKYLDEKEKNPVSS